jgi:mono/diheme cytochrome c family protein
MRKILKWIGWAVCGLVVVAALVIGVLILIANASLGKITMLPVEVVEISSEAAAIKQGQYIACSVCISCHMQILAGGPALNASPRSGVGEEYQDADWARAIRHDVDNEEESLLSMPSPESYFLGNGYLAMVVAYIKPVPPVDSTDEEPYLSVMTKLLLANEKTSTAGMPRAVQRDLSDDELKAIWSFLKSLPAAPSQAPG